MIDGENASSPLRTSPFHTVEFDVQKKNHKRHWIKQRRILRITPTQIHNCKPPEDDNGPAAVTRIHEISNVTTIALKSRTSMMIRFKNAEHDFFYNSPKAVEILHEIRRRLTAIQTVQKLGICADGTSRGEKVKELLEAGALTLPQFADRDELLQERLDFIATVRASAIDGCDNVTLLIADIERDVSELSIEGVRFRVTDLRDAFTDQLMSGTRSFTASVNAKMAGANLPVFEDAADAERCVEEGLQNLIFTACFRQLWEEIQCRPTIVEQERAFRDQCAVLSSQPREFFGVEDDLVDIKYDLVREHLESIPKVKTPSDMMDNICAVARSILLTVKAARQLRAHSLAEAGSCAAEKTVGPSEVDSLATPAEDSSDSSPTHEDTNNKFSSPERVEPSPADTITATRLRSRTLAADDVLPLYIYIMAHSRVDGLVYAREFVSLLGDPTECSERTYFFTVFASAIEFVSSCSPGDDGDSPMSERLSSGALSLPDNSPFSDSFAGVSPRSFPSPEAQTTTFTPPADEQKVVE